MPRQQATPVDILTATLQTSQRKSYDGFKVFRLAVGQDVAKVSGIIEKLDLTT